jgi:AAA+ ATPase superfamily predicted ATPase
MLASREKRTTNQHADWSSFSISEIKLLLCKSLFEHVNDALLIGELPCLELRIKEFAVGGQFEAATPRGN